MNLSLEIGAPRVLKTPVKRSYREWCDIIAANINEASELVYLEGCTDINAFYQKIAGSLDFPDYFGCNLAALADLLNDGDVVKSLSLFIIIADGETFLVDDEPDVLTGLIDTLASVGCDWAAGGNWPWNLPPRTFNTIFQVSNNDQRYAALPSLMP